MRCPKCGCLDDKVIDSRAIREGAGVRRRRECISCFYRYSTLEGVVPEELKVIKRNEVREDFDRDKLRRGIENACYKRPIAPDAVEQLVENITTKLQTDFDKEVNSQEIGNIVMQELQSLDQVAYVRFASVYRKFKDVEEFIEEIRNLQ